MKKYVMHISASMICVLGALFLFFNAGLMKEVWGQLMGGNPVTPLTPITTGIPAVSNSCDEVYFCKHPCLGTSTGDCLEYCAPGQAIGAGCTGTNGATGTCVGACASSLSATTWTSCNQQPTDPLNCPVGDSCIGFSPAQTISGALCQGGCGTLHLSTGSLTLTSSTPGLCATGSTLVTGSLVQHASRRAWSCLWNGWVIDAVTPYQYQCYMAISGSTTPTYTVRGTLGTSGSGAQMNVCGMSVSADSDGDFVATGVVEGTNCSSVSATKPGYMCYITTQGPVFLSSDISNIAGYCVQNGNPTYTLTGTLGLSGAFAQVNVCGSSVVANSSGVFSRSGILQGSNCSGISAQKNNYTCTITTQGPSSIASHVSNVLGNCVLQGSSNGGSSTAGSGGGGKKSSIGSSSSYFPPHAPNTSSTVSPKPGSTVITKRFSERLRTAVDAFDRSCAYTDIDYRALMFNDITRNPEEAAIKTLQAYCIVKGYTISHNKQYHVDAAASVGEAIKVLTKIEAIEKHVSFDEFGWYKGALPYRDMLPNAWYTPYVVYAYEHGFLEGVTSGKVFGRGELKALTPLTKKQFAQLLDNFGVDTSVYRYFDSAGKYVMRDELAALVVDAFSNQLVDYKYLYGNNTLFYRRILGRLEKTTHQEQYLQGVIAQMKKRDKDLMGRKYNLDVEGMITFLESLMQ